MHDCRQTVLDHDRQIAGFEESLQQHDALQITRLAQAHRRFEFDQAKSVRILQRPRRAQQAMSIGVRLDYRQNPRARRVPPHHREVMAQRIEVYGGGDGAGHGSSRMNAE